MESFVTLLHMPVIRFLIVGAVVYVIGMVLLVVLVEKCRITKSRANLTMLAVTLQLSFLLNNFWSFEAVPVESTLELTGRWAQYTFFRSIPIAFEQVGFVFLNNRLRMPYVLASFIVIAVGFAFVFAVSSTLVFVKR